MFYSLWFLSISNPSVFAAVVALSKKSLETNVTSYLDDCFCILESTISFCVFWRYVLPCTLYEDELCTYKQKWRDNWLMSVMLLRENFL